MKSVAEICRQTGISKATFYRLLSSNEEFRKLADAHRERVNRNSYAYDDAVSFWIIEHFRSKPADPDTAAEAVPNATVSAPDNVFSEHSALREVEEENKNFRETIRSHEETIRQLTDKVTELEKDKQSLQQQMETLNQLLKAANLEKQQLLMLLAEEKKENLLLLTPPKKQNLFQKIFGKKDSNN